MNKNIRKTVLLTGANGFIGTYIALQLIQEKKVQILAMVRSRDDSDAKVRLKRAWWEYPELIDALDEGKINILRGDISANNLGLEDSVYKNLVHNLTHIIHTAADLRLNAPLEELRNTNLNGTKNLLYLAQRVHDDHGLERFSFLSTAYVAGKREGDILESDLSSKDGFSSNYERSKFEAETEVRKSKIPFSIFRPGMVVGSSENGAIKTFNTIYVPLRLYLTGKIRLLPISPSNKINLVPVDYIAQSVVNLTFNLQAQNLTFHLTAPHQSLPTVKELIEYTRSWAKDNLGINLPKPLFLPLPPSWTQKILKTAFKEKENNNEKNKRKGSESKGFSKSVMGILAPYIQENRTFVRENTDHLLGPYPNHWKSFIDHILNYAAYMGFFHRSERTVHEQIMHRLQSKNFPVEYFDIINGHIIQQSGPEIRKKIIMAVNALKKLGVKPQDHVAILGHNSTRYFILDVAIGLLGAVSIPLYYTSPLNEIKDILDDSSSKLLFIGTENVLKQVNKLDLHIPIISLSPNSNKPHEGKQASEIMLWEDFLKKGLENPLNENKAKNLRAPVDFKSLATIRYTSGTTGKPRGVMFNHGNLRWMAEFIASMPPWKDRTSNVSYLSFLPLNHVVEGILGTYAPYYAPAPLKLYFLENFQELPSALPKVKPKVFFSVPRFYEKLWDSFQENTWGKIYMPTKNSFLKFILKKFLGNLLLKKAGLDQCSQLIVGSAPISESLIKEFQNLGIEIHNAYGLTEAPLVTINRLGENKSHTVGKPLPETRIKIAPDGEIMVKGPQVTMGYFKKNSSSLFSGQWLLTGDYGHLTPDGSLVITGRKKEVMINSYGKTISPLKIEVLLKSISGVSEAMVIGEQHPYCVALLWVDATPKSISKLDDAIIAINTSLSRPEEIKRWAVLKNDLSIDKGEITANLKLKRESIVKRYEKTIDSLYNGPVSNSDNKRDNIIHSGSTGDNNEH